MSTALKEVSPDKPEIIPNASKLRFALVVSAWNSQITDSLFKAAFNTLTGNGAKRKNILVQKVPGSFELTYGARYFAENSKIDAIICLGCVIQGETRHFEFICNAVANGITEVSIRYNKPVVFGVLTTDTLQQAIDRSGGKYGNKGAEAATTAIQMAVLKKKLS